MSDTKAHVKECNIFFTQQKQNPKSVKLFCKVMVVLNVFNRYRGQEFKMNKEWKKIIDRCDIFWETAKTNCDSESISENNVKLL